MKSFRMLLALVAVLAASCGREGAPSPGAAQRTTIRLGHFPNITHAQALVASQLSRRGKGWFEERLGGGVKIEYYVYNAGPSAMEAIFTHSIDLTYVGPNPVLNAYGKSQGEEIRVVAGAAKGGAALVVPADGRLSSPADFRGKKVATPQLGNTQDVACRAWLTKQGYRVTQTGGDVLVLPTANPDQLALFQTGKVDAVWTVEPWVSRLELEAKGKIYLEEKDALATVLATSVQFHKENRELLRRFVTAHAELTKWINEHPDEAKQLVRAELKELTKRDLPASITDQAWPRLAFSTEISRAPFDALVLEAQGVGFLNGLPDLGKLVIIP
jgi:NitT/TauT family transport system substrate-binding protein